MDLHAAVGEVGGQRGDEAFEAPVDRIEDGRRGGAIRDCGRGGLLLLLLLLRAQAAGEAARTARDGRELRGRDVDAQRVGAAGVDATDQRVDQPLIDFASIPFRDQSADRRVRGQRRARQERLERGARQSLRRQQTRPRQGPEPRRHPEHQTGRQRAQRAATPQERAAGGGRDEVVA